EQHGRADAPQRADLVLDVGHLGPPGSRPMPTGVVAGSRRQHRARAPPRPDDAASDMPAPEPDEQQQRNLRLVALGVSLSLLVALLVAAGLTTIPYKTLRPGSARPVAEHIYIDGVETYEPTHSVAFTTVSVGDATILEALGGWLDPEIDVFPREVIEGDRDAEENRRYNAELMDVSKLTATTVALRTLGYEVTLHTSGTVVRRMAEGSPAAEVLQLDDVIVAVDGE